MIITNRTATQSAIDPIQHDSHDEPVYLHYQWWIQRGHRTEAPPPSNDRLCFLFLFLSHFVSECLK